MKEEKNTFFKNLDEISSLFELQLEESSITLSLQQIELFQLAVAPTFERLKKIASTITGITFPITYPTITQEEFEQLRISCVKTYQDSLKDHSEAYSNQDNSLVAEIGIKETSYETFYALAQEISKYSSITLNKEVGFDKLYQGGTFNLSSLESIEKYVKEKDKRMNFEGLFDSRFLTKLESLDREMARTTFHNYLLKVAGYTASLMPYRVGKERVRTIEITGLLKDGEGIRKYFTIEEIGTLLVEMKRKIPGTIFIYQEEYSEDEYLQKCYFDNVRTLLEIGKKEFAKIVERLGLKLHVTIEANPVKMANHLEMMNDFGLPLEINDYEMTIPLTSLSLPKEQLLDSKRVAQQNFLNILTSLLGRIDLRNLGIGSLTMFQSETLDKINYERFKENQDLFDTLYGGYYQPVKEEPKELNKEEMEDEKIPKREGLPKYMYHIHTKAFKNDSEPMENFILKAIEAGFKQIGFTEYAPLPHFIEPNFAFRLTDTEKDNYIKEAQALKEKYHDKVEILIGLEAPYEDSLEEYLIDLRKEVDFLVLGEHIEQSPLKKQCFRYDAEKKRDVLIDPLYPTYYQEDIVKGIQSGIFDFVAHPDSFYTYRDDLTNEYQLSLYTENAYRASMAISSAAFEMDIPLEINYSGLVNSLEYKDKEFSYPFSVFWRVIKEKKNKVILGLDAKESKTLSELSLFYEKIKAKVPVDELLILEEYNPVLARRSNLKLQEVLRSRFVTSETYETKYIIKIIQETIEIFPPNISFSDIKQAVHTKLEREETYLFQKRQEVETPEMVDYIDTHLRAIQSALDSYEIAMNLGVSSTSEFILAMSQITELKTTKNESKKVNAYKIIKDISLKHHS